MAEKVVLVRFGEISLKGKNRHVFEEILLNNIKAALSGLGARKIEKAYGRIYIEFNDDFKEIAERLKKVFGIVSFSPSLKTELDMEKIKEVALNIMRNFNENTFKVKCRRPNKNFPLKSPEINRQVGGFLLEKMDGWKVDVHNPDRILDIEIREEGAYVYAETVKGQGGLPVGCTGRGILLLSGGIDSPVAAYMAMKRGVDLVGLHFYSFPFTSERSKEKVLDICRVLAGYCGNFTLYINHFTDIQKEIRKRCPEKYYVTIMRRMMVRIAHRLAGELGALALFTGENLGQVASQTLESMRVTNAVTDYPVLRPLLTLDKQEIIELAEAIGTYEISIRPYEDCCTLFVPKHPVTRPHPDNVHRAEKDLDIDKLLESSLDKMEVLSIKPGL